MNLPKLKYQLFDTYSKNFALVRPHYPELHEFLDNEYDEALICPLCLTVFNKSALKSHGNKPPKLSVEHLPPESLGGKGAIITCTECNNTSGAKLDSKVLDYMKTNQHEYFEGKVVSKDLKFGSRAKLRIDFEKRHFDFELCFSDENRREIFSRLRIKDRHAFDFHFRSTPKMAVEICLLRIAYLLAFKKFGHFYIMNVRLDELRDQIARPTENILNLCGINSVTGFPFPDDIYLVDKDSNRFLFVLFTLFYQEKSERVGVFLPSPFDDPIEFYERLGKLSIIQLSPENFEFFKKEDFLLDEKFVSGIYRPFHKQ